MYNKIVKIKITKRENIKIGDKVLFGSDIVKILAINNEYWTFEGNEIVGKTLTMPSYNSYYKLVK